MGRDIIVTMVTGTRDVEEVVLGPSGVIHGAGPGTVVIDMSTISPDATRNIAAALGKQQIRMLDAPVTGGPAGAAAATLTIMVGGDAGTLEHVRPVLERLGSKIFHMGACGAGQVAKACNQLALLVTAEGVAEALALGRCCGLDVGTLRHALLGGLASSRVLELFGARMVDRHFDDGIETRLYHKDLDILLTLARETGIRLPGGEVVKEHIDDLMNRNLARADLAALITTLEPST
jgi:2-hydroxy-3-oxopropionate reductase